ncbi:hypothetical protein L7F22_006631 [Adiantum nelumboides]|nr:hypothetical protein [Adiantum nelumboides]
MEQLMLLFLIVSCIMWTCQVRARTVFEGLSHRRLQAEQGDVGFNGKAGALQDCKCQHCPCLYGESDANCRLCFICDEYVASEPMDESKTMSSQAGTVGSGREGPRYVINDATVYAPAPLVSSRPAVGVKYAQNDVGSSCCSTNSCCYFQF